ncbi:hypothetical protein F5B19DRAFT_267800 [Rostrohypoxylon terebratum]|nr:hypothetical protein F5B19DRAFT_267800 [Rostrohypoxylon terebratum]
MSHPRTMDHPVSTGATQSWKERYRLGRRFGKYDSGRFEVLRTSNHILGAKKLGDIDVACKFLLEESRWGVLTPNKNPGGVIYLELTFSEPIDCRLKGATVTVTLEELEAPKTNSRPNEIPVHIIRYGPDTLQGGFTEAFKIKQISAIPSIEVLGAAELSGVGYNSQTRQILQSQWKFMGQGLPNAQGHQTKLSWRLVESKLEFQSSHDNKFYTAFAFKHSGQPFLIQVDVSGEVEKGASYLFHKTKQKLKKLKFPMEPKTAITLVDFSKNSHLFTDPLDQLAERLPEEMVERNMKPIAQVPGKPNNPEIRYEIAQDDIQEIEDEFNEVVRALATPRQPSMGNDRPRDMIETPPQPSTQETGSLNEENATIESPILRTDQSFEAFRESLEDIAIPAWSRMMILWILFACQWIRISPPQRRTSRSSGGKYVDISVNL